MAEVVTYKGTTIWSDAVDGFAFKTDPSGAGMDVERVGAPLGTGYWNKAGNIREATISVFLVWATTDKSAIRNTLNALADHTTGTLVTPDWGTFTNCLLDGVPQFETMKGPGDEYMISLTLSFIQQP